MEGTFIKTKHEKADAKKSNGKPMLEGLNASAALSGRRLIATEEKTLTSEHPAGAFAGRLIYRGANRDTARHMKAGINTAGKTCPGRHIEKSIAINIHEELYAFGVL